MRVENLSIEPDQRARVVINERTGMVIAGGNVRISQVTISQGDLKVAITTQYQYAGPNYLWPPPLTPYAGLGGRGGIVPQTDIEVDEGEARNVSLQGNSTVADLVRSLSAIHTSPRDMISILQGMKTAGALYADLIIQ
jgi:flagellar P-ring protein precursor FlgI